MRVVRPFVQIRVGGRTIKVRQILSVTPTHVVVEHLDGRIEVIPLEQPPPERRPVLV